MEEVMGKRGLAPLMLSLSSVLVLAACVQRLTYTEQPAASGSNHAADAKIPSIPEEAFQYAVGWLDDRTILVVLESNGEAGLYSHDLHTGEDQLIRNFSDRLVFVALSANGRRMLLQLAAQQGNNVMVIDKSGSTLAEYRLSEGALTDVSWNPANEGQLFFSAQKTVGSSVAYLWDLSNNIVEETADTEEMPIWYSENMYLHKKNWKDGASTLLLSDIRSPGKDIVIDQEVLAYGIEGESVWIVTPSDFDEEELLVLSYYPLLIAEGYVTLPRISAGSGLIIPEFAGGTDMSGTFAVIPTAGPQNGGGISYALAKIDFSGNAAVVLSEVDRMAPLSVSPNGMYVLYGHRYEYLYDVEQAAWIQLTVKK